jgi:hypothetical protein
MKRVAISRFLTEINYTVVEINFELPVEDLASRTVKASSGIQESKCMILRTALVLCLS